MTIDENFFSDTPDVGERIRASWGRSVVELLSDRQITDAEVAFGLELEDINSGYDPGDVRRYGDNANPGVTDMTEALRTMYRIAAQESITTGRPSKCWIVGKCLVTERIAIEGAIAGITTYGDDGELIVDATIGDGIPALHFGYALDDSDHTFDVTRGRVATTTATVAVSRTSRTVTVVSTSGMVAGMMVTLASDSEYFFGITGDSGNQPKMKSELNRIRSVDSATALTLDHFPEDSYSVTGPVVTVSAYNSIENIKFYGLTVTGTGGGSAHGGSPTGLGPEAIRVEWCRNAWFKQGAMRNFGFTPWRDVQCWGVQVTGNGILGRDPEDSTNLPNISQWFYGPTHNGSCHVVFADNTCENLRRPNEAGPESGQTIPRHIIQAYNNVTGCGNGMGVHCSQYVTAIANEMADCASGYFYRAKDITIIGGHVRYTGTGTSAAAVSLGSIPGGAYSEDPSLGHVEIRDLTVSGGVNFLLCQNAFDSMTISGNKHFDGAGNGIWISSAKSIRNLEILGNHLDTANRSTTKYVVYVESHVDNPIEDMDGVTIEGNTLLNGLEAVRLEGPSLDTSPAKHVTIRNNTFPFCSVGAPTADIRLGTAGFYDGSTAQLGPNSHNSGSGSKVLLSSGADDMHRYTQLPLREPIRRVVGYATSSTMTGRDWASSAAKAVFQIGMRVINSQPGASEYDEWMATVNGTGGTLAGCTGDISSGTDDLVINDNSTNQVFVGSYITIAGAGPASANLAVRVTAVNGTAITVDTNASTTVVAAAISYTNPTFKGVGLIET